MITTTNLMLHDNDACLVTWQGGDEDVPPLEEPVVYDKGHVPGKAGYPFVKEDFMPTSADFGASGGSGGGGSGASGDAGAVGGSGIHPTPATLHSAPYTHHLTPYIHHRTPFTLHP